MRDHDPQQPGSEGRASETSQGARADRRERGGRTEPEPHITYIGPTAVWWIPKPRGPRWSAQATAIAWMITLPTLAATMLWIEAQSGLIWPFGRRIVSPVEILLRYELIIIVYLTYLMLRSLPAWLRFRAWARRDAVVIDTALREEQWERAGLHLHRYCLLVSAVWHRVPARVSAWDSMIRKRLSRHRRLYLYYDKEKPPLPPDPRAGFVPEIVPPAKPSFWSIIVLVPIAFLLYLLILDIRRRGEWQQLLFFNVVLLSLLVVSYGIYFLLALLGRSHFFRFAPGVFQVVRFTIRRRRPVIKTFDLRQNHLALDVSSPGVTFTLLDAGNRRRPCFRLPSGDDVVEALLRASLSTTPSPPLSEEDLVD